LQKTDAICEVVKPFNLAMVRRCEVSSRVNLVKYDAHPKMYSAVLHVGSPPPQSSSSLWIGQG